MSCSTIDIRFCRRDTREPIIELLGVATNRTVSELLSLFRAHPDVRNEPISIDTKLYVQPFPIVSSSSSSSSTPPSLFAEITAHFYLDCTLEALGITADNTLLLVEGKDSVVHALSEMSAQIGRLERRVGAMCNLLEAERVAKHEAMSSLQRQEEAMLRVCSSSFVTIYEASFQALLAEKEADERKALSALFDVGKAAAQEAAGKREKTLSMLAMSPCTADVLKITQNEEAQTIIEYVKKESGIFRPFYFPRAILKPSNLYTVTFKHEIGKSNSLILGIANHIIPATAGNTYSFGSNRGACDFSGLWMHSVSNVQVCVKSTPVTTLPAFPIATNATRVFALVIDMRVENDSFIQLFVSESGTPDGMRLVPESRRTIESRQYMLVGNLLQNDKGAKFTILSILTNQPPI